MNTPTSPTPGSFSTDRLGEERGHPLARRVEPSQRYEGSLSVWGIIPQHSLQNMGFSLGWGGNLGSFCWDLVLAQESSGPGSGQGDQGQTTQFFQYLISPFPG